jgi:hypothetical protein
MVRATDMFNHWTDRLPHNFSTVIISWSGHPPVESKVIAYSAHGIRVQILKSLPQFAAPRKNISIRVRIVGSNSWLTGMCMSSDKHDKSLTLGIYLYSPSEQNYLRDIMYSSIVESQKSRPLISHDWEEFVDSLCHSKDRQVQKIGFVKRDIIDTHNRIANRLKRFSK